MLPGPIYELRTVSFITWPHLKVCRILFPQTGMEPGPSVVNVLSPNCWTTREFPKGLNFYASCLSFPLLGKPSPTRISSYQTPNHPSVQKDPLEKGMATHPSILFFFFFSFISWRLITLQYCSGCCHTLTWISHGFTCIPHPDPPSHLALYPIPLGLPSAPGQSTCLMHPTWAGDLFHPR